MGLTQFDRSQQALERLLGHYDRLLQQESRSKALTHTAQRFGISRAKVATLVFDRDQGFHDENHDAPQVRVHAGAMMQR